MEKSIFRFIMHYSWKQQLLLLVLTLLSFPFLYASLDLPKTIVNKAIEGTGFPKTFYGFEFSQLEYLFTLCGIFLLLVGINGGFKYVINVYKGLVGERMLRRFRYQLFGHTLRFPLPHFRRTSQGEIIAMITAEVEPLGGFIGDAVALPAFQGGTLATIIAFMFVQDWVLGTAAVALYPLQVYFIPKLQRQVNRLAKERVRTVRRLSQRIGEAVTSIGEIHGNDTSELHRADFARWSGTIFDIRFQIYRKKFFIKFLNNFIAQLTPFFFFSIGGYLVIKEQLSFGALVAVLAAYKDLSSPWKELLDWYQQKEDARVKYDQLVEQFVPPGLLDDELQAVPDGPVPHLPGPVVAQALSLDDEGGLRLVDRVSFQFELDEKVALVGAGGSGADEVARMLARLIWASGGSIRCGGEFLRVSAGGGDRPPHRLRRRGCRSHRRQHPRQSLLSAPPAAPAAAVIRRPSPETAREAPRRSLSQRQHALRSGRRLDRLRRRRRRRSRGADAARHSRPRRCRPRKRYVRPRPAPEHRSGEESPARNVLPGRP